MSCDDPMEEARRVMTLCAVCGYCDGVCAVFRAAERRLSAEPFSSAETALFAHLCHDCRDCLAVCQYAPPHPFAIDVPAALAAARQTAWRNRAGTLVPLLALIAVPALALALVPAGVLFSRHLGPGAFYAVIPRPAMLALAVGGVGWTAVGLVFQFRRAWRTFGGGRMHWTAAALKDLLSLRRLGGARRWFHHALFYGLALAALASVLAAVWGHLSGLAPPYPWTSPPVVAGICGGIAMTAGAAGLWWRGQRAPVTLLLLATAASGLALLALRAGAAMGSLLALHLGCVLALLLALPLGKLAHAPWRAAAVVRVAEEE